MSSGGHGKTFEASESRQRTANMWVFLALLAVAAASQSLVDQEVAFRPGFDHKYNYETQVLTGVSVDNTQFAGLKIKALINIQQSRDDERMTAQFERAEFYKLNREISHYHPTENIPESEWTPISGPEKDLMWRELRKTFTYKFNMRQLSDLKCQSDEAMWSVNVKRGFLSFIQLDMQPNHVERSSEELNMLSKLDIGGRMEDQDRRDLNSYTVYEEDIVGNCESVYTKQPLSPEADRFRQTRNTPMHLTKVRNLQKCRQRPYWQTGLLESVIFGSDYEVKKVTQWEQHGSYKVTQSPGSYLIHQAYMASQQHFNKIDIKRGKLITYTTQWVNLAAVEESREQIRIRSDMEKKDKLTMEVPEPSIREREQTELSQSEVRAKVNLMEQLLQEAEQKVLPFIKRNATQVVAKMNILMRELPVSEVENFVNRYVRGQQISQKGELVLDVLTTCTRPDTVPLIVRLVKQRKISDVRGSYMMMQISMLGTSSPKLASDLIQQLNQELQPQQQQCRHTRRTALLALGSVAFKLQMKHKRHPHQLSYLEPVIQRIAQELIKLLREAGQQQDLKLNVIKAMGNAGLPQCTRELFNIVRNHNEPIYVREKACYALRRIAPSIQSEIFNELVPIYKDQNQPKNLRIAAFIVMTLSKPEYGRIKLLALQLQQERSNHVGSFVWSFMRSKSQVQNPSVANVTAAYKKALTYARPFNPGFQYSKGLMTDAYSKTYKSGFGIYLEYLTSVEALLPETIVHRQDYDMGGFPWFGYETGIELTGIQTLMRNLVGPKSVLKELLQGRYSVQDLLRPIERPSSDMLSHIRTMMDKISITERQLRNFNADVYMKNLDIEINYYDFTPAEMGEIISYAFSGLEEILRKIETGWDFQKARAFPIIDSAFIIPTPAGLPLSLNLTWNTVVSLDGNLKVDNMPSARDLMRTYGRYDDQDRKDHYKRDKNWRSSKDKETRLQVRVRPTIETDVECFVGVELAFLRTGAATNMKIYAHQPIRAELKLDHETGKLKTKLHTSNEVQPLVSFVVNPKTVFIQRPFPPSYERMYIEEKVINFPRIAQVETYRRSYEIPFLNADLRLSSERVVLKPNAKTTLDLNIFTRKNYTILWQPKNDMAREISMETLFLGPQRADRSRDLVHDLLDIERDSDSDSEDRDQQHRRRQQEDSDSWWWTWGSSDRTDRRQQRQDRSRTIPFDEVRPMETLQQQRTDKYKYITVIKAHGGRDDQKKVQVQVTHVQSDDLKKVQHDVQVIYESPYDQQEKKAKLVHFTDFDVIKKFLIDGDRSSRKDVLSKLELFYGRKDYAQKKIDVELKMGRGQPLQRLSRVHIDRTYIQRTEDAPLELSATIDYQDIPRAVKKACKKVQDLSKFLPYLYDQVEVEDEEARNPPNKLKLVAEFQTNETEIDLLIMTPTETELIKGLPIPFLPKRDAVCSLSGINCYNKYLSGDQEKWRSSGSRPVDSFIHYMSDGKFPGKCEVIGQKVYTYDKESIHYPETDCEIILAKDCSSRSSPSFMVTTKDKNKDENKKVVHIYTPEHKIKIEPKSGWFESEIEVEIDGRKISVPSEGQKITIRKDPSDPRSEKVCDIKKEHGKVKVYSYKSQIKVSTDGKDVSVKVHPSYFSQLCGVCSNYNGEPMDDLQGPRMERFQRPEQFLLSYIMPSSQCNIDEVRSRLSRGVPQLFLTKDNQCRMMQRNRFTPREQGDARVDCFSIKPVNTCPAQCEPRDTRRQRLPYLCLPANSPEAQQLLAKWRRGEILTELKSKTPNWQQDVFIPNRCQSRRDRNLVDDKDEIIKQ